VDHTAEGKKYVVRAYTSIPNRFFCGGKRKLHDIADFTPVKGETPLKVWMAAAWYLISEKHGVPTPPVSRCANKQYAVRADPADRPGDRCVTSIAQSYRSPSRERAFSRNYQTLETKRRRRDLCACRTFRQARQSVPTANSKGHWMRREHQPIRSLGTANRSQGPRQDFSI
jgi:hypothetical protein